MRRPQKFWKNSQLFLNWRLLQVISNKRFGDLFKVLWHKISNKNEGTSLHDCKLTNWQFNNLAIFNFDNFGNFQLWQLQFWKLSILKTFVLCYFQAKYLNGFQEQQQQHINCIDLAIKITSFFTGLCKNTNSM